MADRLARASAVFSAVSLAAGAFAFGSSPWLALVIFALWIGWIQVGSL